MKQIIIIGGGFAGIRTARRLRKQKDISITLVNDSPDFRYCPALYRAATGFKLGTARLPIEWMLLDSSNTNLLINKAVSIDVDKKQIGLADNSVLDYDFAVFALGSVTTYFNVEGLREHSYGIKTITEVDELRRHLHCKIDERSTIEENYVIVGAGPTGVETAGALGAYLERIARKHKTTKHHKKIWLVEAAPRILPQMSPRASQLAHKKLTKLGIKIEVSTQVTAESIKTLQTSSGPISTHTVVWTAGTTNNPFFGNNPTNFKINERHKVVVDKHLLAHPSVYVIGDNAATTFSGTAFTAIKHGNFTAKDIAARLNHRHRPRKYESHPIQVVPVGVGWAILQYRSLVFSGRPISWIRKIADYIGYSDVVGYIKALTIWSNSEKLEEVCARCKRRA